MKLTHKDQRDGHSSPLKGTSMFHRPVTELGTMSIKLVRKSQAVALTIHVAGLAGQGAGMRRGRGCRARQSRCPYHTRPPRVPAGLIGCTNDWCIRQVLRVSRDQRNPRRTAHLMPPSPSPHKGMAMCIPILGCLFHRFAQFFPTEKALAGKSQRTQVFPPGFNQVQIGCSCRLKDKFPSRMSQSKK